MESMPPLTAKRYRFLDSLRSLEMTVENSLEMTVENSLEMTVENSLEMTVKNSLEMTGEADRESSISPLISSTLCLKRSSIIYYVQWYR